MPYEVMIPELTIPKALTETFAPDGRFLGYDHVSETFVIGQTVEDWQVSPQIHAQYINDDPHICACLRWVGEGDGPPVHFAHEIQREPGFSPISGPAVVAGPIQEEPASSEEAAAGEELPPSLAETQTEDGGETAPEETTAEAPAEKPASKRGSKSTEE